MAVAGFLCTALTRPPRGRTRAYGPVALLAGAVLFALDRGDLLVAAILLAALGLGASLARTDDASVAPGEDASQAAPA
ncbi:endonuclease, partial [Micromonospora sp. STR1s_6]|nr:endonuclease [Micromonospora tarensis]